MRMYLLGNKKDEKVLRTKASSFDFSRSKKDIKDLIKGMRQIMKEYDGIGLAANQIGLLERIFIAYGKDKRGKLKFYALFNPEIIKTSDETNISDEGCLSIPGITGEVERYNEIVLQAQDETGKKVKILAVGLLARVFQHEMDHLNGVLFIDKAKKINNGEE